MKRILILRAFMLIAIVAILFLPSASYAQTEPTPTPTFQPPDCYQDWCVFTIKETIPPDYRDVVPQKTPAPEFIISCCTRSNRIYVDRIYYKVEAR